jgi:2-dehydropantoate 2-reductase
MKHAILGAGAIGGVMAVGLSSLGEDVTLIVRAEKLAAHPTTLTVEHLSGTMTAPAKIAAGVNEAFDVLWIATKTYQLEEALALVDVVPGVVVPLLNGVDHVAVLRARFGHDRVVPGTIAVEAERSASGHFIYRSAVRLNLAASGEPVLEHSVEGLRGLGWTCNFIASEPTLLWTKLCFLEPFALVTSASGKNNGEILADAEWKGKMDSAVREACAVAAKEGAQIDPDKWAPAFSGMPATMRASMAKDLDAGRKLELDGIAGPILRGGLRYGIPTPTTAALVATIEAKSHNRSR